MISHFCKHQAKTDTMLAVCPRNIYVLCCDVVDVLQVVFVDKIVDFELAMFANEGIISK